MKKLFTGLVLAGLAYAQPAAAHKEWIHQYMVQQAYFFLENQIGAVPALREAAGIDYGGAGNNYHGVGGDIIYTPANQIAIGAWREDVEDWVYGYGDSNTNGATPSITHFWKADAGDDARAVSLGGQPYENAWEKARIYLFCNNSRGGSHSITVPYSANGYTKRYIITYTSLPDLYKGNYYLVGISDNSGYNYQTVGQSRVDPVFGHAVALNLLGRVAHLLGDMSVPAHAHAHLHPCPLGFPDYYENDMGGVWRTNNHTDQCESDPNNAYPARSWNAWTARQQGGFLDDIYCQYSPQAQMRFLFYSLNQLTDYFPSGVNAQNEPNSPPTNRNYRVQGNSDLPNGSYPYIQARYQVLQAKLGGPPTAIVEQDIADEVFNGSIRSVATLFQWFAYESGIMATLDNATIVSSKYTLCPGQGAQVFTLSNGNTAYASWSVDPSATATGTLTNAGFEVVPDPNNSGVATVKASFYASYGPCETRYVTASRIISIGLQPLAITTPNLAYDGYNLPPGVSFEISAPRPNYPITATRFDWSADNGASVYGYGSAGKAYVTAPTSYSTPFNITCTAYNDCGSATITQPFQTQDQNPQNPNCPDCLQQAQLVHGGAPPTDNAKASALTQKQPAGFEVSPNPSTGSFTIYYVRESSTPTAAGPPASFVLVDVLGRLVSSGSLSTPTTRVVTSQLSTGIYLLKVMDNGTAHYKRVQITQ